ncbi:stage II sporulation protein M [Clostridium tyrobutyricum]
MYVNIYKILISNLGFYICLILLGLVHKKLPYLLFYYNSIMFTGASIIYLDTNKLLLYLIKIMPHGILEILGLSVGVYIGNTLKDRDFKGKLRLFVIGIFLIIISALIEIKISYNI